MNTSVSEGLKQLFSVRLEFKIKQKSNTILYLIKGHIGGNITYIDSEALYHYTSTSFNVANKVIGYFDKHHLNSSKHIRYLKWRKAYRIIQRKGHLTQAGLDKLRSLKGNLRD